MLCNDFKVCGRKEMEAGENKGMYRERFQGMYIAVPF